MGVSWVQKSCGAKHGQRWCWFPGAEPRSKWPEDGSVGHSQEPGLEIWAWPHLSLLLGPLFRPEKIEVRLLFPPKKTRRRLGANGRWWRAVSHQFLLGAKRAEVCWFVLEGTGLPMEEEESSPAALQTQNKERSHVGASACSLPGQGSAWHLPALESHIA